MKINNLNYKVTSDDTVEVVNGNYFYMTSVTIPETVTYRGKICKVTSIGNYAFYGCSNLTTVTIPNSVISIGFGTFHNCSGLTTVTFKENSQLISIGYSAFSYCSSLTSFAIPNSVTSIGSEAFRSCSGLKSIDIPNSVTSIGKYAFFGCYNLSSVNIPNSITSIGCSAFKSCGNVSHLDVQNNKKVIAYKGFNATSKGLQCNNYTFEEGKTYVEDYAIMCVCGFHAYLNPLDVFNYYYGELSELEFHEVTLSGQFDSYKGYSKICATTITIGKKVSVNDISTIFNHLPKM